MALDDRRNALMWAIGWWLMRPLYPFARAVLARNQRKARYHLLQITGRWRGWCDHGR